MSRLAQLVTAALICLGLLLAPALAPAAAATNSLCRNGFYLVPDNAFWKFDENGDRGEQVARLPARTNALAYFPAEEVFYGLSAGDVVKVSVAGNVIARAPAPKELRKSYAATISGDRWIVHDGEHVFWVRLPDLAVVATAKLPNLAVAADWDRFERDGMLYGVRAGDPPRLVKFDPASGTVREVTVLPELPRGSSFGGAAIDPHGVLHVLHNKTGRLYHLPLAAPRNHTFTELGLSAKESDAAACPAAWDFGDAPEGYDTTLTSDGPRHTVTTEGELTIGAAVTAESDSGESDTDDAFGAELSIDSDVTGLELVVSVRNTTATTALLAGWHDLDGNGTFSDKELATVQVPPNTDSVTLVWDRVAVAESGDGFVLRLRLFGRTPPGGPSPNGPASGGEVEDHEITVRRPVPVPSPPSPTPAPAPPPPVIVEPPPSVEPSLKAARPGNPPPSSRLPVTLSLFAGMVIPAITVAVRSNVRRGGGS